MLSTEEKQHYSKIKKLFFERDFEKIDLGIDLIKSLNSKNLFDEFLKEVELNIGYDEIVGGNFNNPFKHNWGTTGPDQHYYTTAILGLINYMRGSGFKHTLICLIALSLILELSHLIIPNRSFQSLDLLSNLLGTLLAIVIIFFYKRFKNGKI